MHSGDDTVSVGIPRAVYTLTVGVPQKMKGCYCGTLWSVQIYPITRAQEKTWRSLLKVRSSKPLSTLDF